MKHRSSDSLRHGFTLIELLVVIAIISVLASMLLPAFSRAKEKARRIYCTSNQKQLNYGLRMWGDDNGSRYPWQVSLSQEGTRGSTLTWQHLIVLAPYVVTPKLMVCPSDLTSGRLVAYDFSAIHTNGLLGLQYIGNYGVSYFVGLDATEQRPMMPLLGDRDIAGKEQQDCPFTGETGVVTWMLPTNSPTWTLGACHSFVAGRAGNIALADGSVQGLNQHGLSRQFAAAAADTHANCALKPDFGAT